MKRSFLLTLLAPIVVAGSLNAASVDYLLEIDGIKGESSDDKHREAIEIQSFSWGVSNSGTFGSGGGGGTGKVSFQDVHFTARISKATPQLLLACATGTHIREATITCRKAGGDGTPYEYMTITLEEVFLKSQKQTGLTSSTATAADDRPTEEVAFYYNKITIVHTAEDGTLTTGQAVRTPETTTPPQ